MSARDELFLWIDDSLSTEMASQLIDAYAHELAEQIRDSVANADSVGPYSAGILAAINHAVDKIDPEVN